MLIFALLLVVAAPETVSAKLARAEAAAAALDLDIARDILIDVVSDATATPAEQKRAHLLAGEVDRILGKDVEARMHFMWVLQREPDLQLPPDKPPKISAFFELVRAEVKGREPAPPGPPTPLAPAGATTTNGAATTAAPSTTPASAEPAVAPSSARLPMPAIVAGVGAAGAIGGVALAVMGESRFAATGAPWVERENGQYTALLGWTVAGASAAIATAGLVMWSAAP